MQIDIYCDVFHFRLRVTNTWSFRIALSLGRIEKSLSIELIQ